MSVLDVFNQGLCPSVIHKHASQTKVSVLDEFAKIAFTLFLNKEIQDFRTWGSLFHDKFEPMSLKLSVLLTSRLFFLILLCSIDLGFLPSTYLALP